MKRYKTILLGCLAVSPLFFTSCEKRKHLKATAILKTTDGCWSGQMNSIPLQKIIAPTLQNGHTNWEHRDSVTVNCRIIRTKKKCIIYHLQW